VLAATPLLAGQNGAGLSQGCRSPRTVNQGEEAAAESSRACLGSALLVLDGSLQLGLVHA
jgi:hypothetical protein